MNTKQMARKLGRKGGLARAKRLSPKRRKEIARMGAKARQESILLANRITSNFNYVAAIRKLRPPPKITSSSTVRNKIPGLAYE